MRSGFLVVAAGTLALCVSSALASSGDDAKKALQGVWVAQSMEADGMPVPPEIVAKIQFSFKAEKLIIKGNHDDAREEECTYTLDAKQSPHHLDFTAPNQDRPVQGIYELKGDELKLCLRHNSSSEGRPTEFATKADSRLVLLVLKKQKS